MFERVLSDLLQPLLPMRVGNEEPFNCLSKHRTGIPDARDKYGGDLKVMDNRISLKGRTLQVIVRLANIILTPERPEYPGGSWHVEGSSQLCFVFCAEFFKPQGMRNEMIVSSFIYVSLSHT